MKNVFAVDLVDTFDGLKSPLMFTYKSSVYVKHG